MLSGLKKHSYGIMKTLCKAIQIRGRPSRRRVMDMRRGWHVWRVGN